MVIKKKNPFDGRFELSRAYQVKLKEYPCKKYSELLFEGVIYLNYAAQFKFELEIEHRWK